MNKVYAVTYSDCIYESAYAVLTIHKTMIGCVKAMIKMKERLFYERISSNYKSFKFGDIESIRYRVIKIDE